MASDYKIFWTEEAISNLEDILDYLIRRWSKKEIENFKKLLAKQIELIEQNPKLFPVSQTNPDLRKAVLSKQTTIFYKISGTIIYLVFIFNNKQNIGRINR